MSSVLSELSLPFHPEAIDWKPQSISKDKGKAMAIAYADLRAYMNRLDQVCGMDWSVDYVPWGDRIICNLTIGGVKRSSTGESDKQSESSEIGGTSAEAQAFKRAAAMFGLGRYLYDLPSRWVEIDEYKKFTPQALAQLNKMITDHYQRHSKTVNKVTGEIAEHRGPSNSKEAIAPSSNGSDKLVEYAEQELQGVPLKPAGYVSPVIELRKQVNLLGNQLYGDNWFDVSQHNVGRMTNGKYTHVDDLTAEELTRMIAGLNQLKAKAKVAA